MQKAITMQREKQNALQEQNSEIRPLRLSEQARTKTEMLYTPLHKKRQHTDVCFGIVEKDLTRNNS